MFGFRIISARRHDGLLKAKAEYDRIIQDGAAHCERLDDLEISPNGDDYNDLLDIILGAPFNPATMATASGR